MYAGQYTEVQDYDNYASEEDSKKETVEKTVEKSEDETVECATDGERDITEAQRVLEFIQSTYEDQTKGPLHSPENFMNALVNIVPRSHNTLVKNVKCLVGDDKFLGVSEYRIGLLTVLFGHTGIKGIVVSDSFCGIVKEKFIVGEISTVNARVYKISEEEVCPNIMAHLISDCRLLPPVLLKTYFNRVFRANCVKPAPVMSRPSRIRFNDKNGNAFFILEEHLEKYCRHKFSDKCYEVDFNISLVAGKFITEMFVNDGVYTRGVANLSYDAMICYLKLVDLLGL